MYVKRSATLVMNLQQYDTLKSAREIIKDLYDNLNDDEECINTVDTYDLEDMEQNLNLIIDAGEVDGIYVNFKLGEI
jgi:hypothetical protein